MRAKRVTSFSDKSHKYFHSSSDLSKKVAEQLEILIILLMKKGSGKPFLFCQKLCLCRHFGNYIFTSTIVNCKKGFKRRIISAKGRQNSAQFRNRNSIFLWRFLTTVNYIFVRSFCQVMCNRDK